MYFDVLYSLAMSLCTDVFKECIGLCICMSCHTGELNIACSGEEDVIWSVCWQVWTNHSTRPVPLG